MSRRRGKPVRISFKAKLNKNSYWIHGGHSLDHLYWNYFKINSSFINEKRLNKKVKKI